jgi:hypothetical protein
MTYNTDETTIGRTRRRAFELGEGGQVCPVTASCAKITGLERGLPKGFDFAVLRSADDAESLMCRLPTADRGRAAVAIVEQSDLIDREIAYHALISAWDHDHDQVFLAFETHEAIVAAFRAVASPTRRTERVRVWRGCNEPEGWYGPSWTLDRDCACWFAMRFGSTPFVYGCNLDPTLILAEHDGRSEREVIVDFLALDFVFLDEDDGHERNAADVGEHDEVSAGALKNWEVARNRWAAKLKLSSPLR